MPLVPWICFRDWLPMVGLPSSNGEHAEEARRRQSSPAGDYTDCRKPLHKCARASPTAPRTAGVRSITPLSRPLAQETGKHDQATRTTREHACTACQGACAHADARSRLRIVSFASHACVALPLSPRSLTHTANSQHKLTHENISHPKP